MKGRLTVEVTFDVLPFLGPFDVVVTGDDTVRHKPDPEPLLLALDQLGATAETAAYVGDSPFDIRAAKAAGMTAIAVSWGNIHPTSTARGRAARRGTSTSPGQLADVL